MVNELEKKSCLVKNTCPIPQNKKYLVKPEMKDLPISDKNGARVYHGYFKDEPEKIVVMKMVKKDWCSEEEKRILMKSFLIT